MTLQAPPTARRRTWRRRSVVPIAVAGFQTVYTRPPSRCPPVWRSLPLRKPTPATVLRAELPRAAMEPAAHGGRRVEANHNGASGAQLRRDLQRSDLAQRQEQGDDTSKSTSGLCWRAREVEPRAAPVETAILAQPASLPTVVGGRCLIKRLKLAAPGRQGRIPFVTNSPRRRSSSASR